MSKHVHNSHAYSVIIPKTENCCALGQKNFKLDGVGEGGGGTDQPPDPGSHAYGKTRWLFTSVADVMSLRDYPE